MKKLLFLLLFTGFIFAQAGKSSITQAQGDTAISKLNSIKTNTDSLNILLRGIIDGQGNIIIDSLVIADTINVNFADLYPYLGSFSIQNDTIISKLGLNNTQNTTIINRLDTLIAKSTAMLYDTLVNVNNRIYNKTDSLYATIKPTDTFSGSVFVVDTVATRITAVDAPCKYVYIMNNTPDAEVYFLPTASLTRVNGYGRLLYLDEIRIEIDNLNKIYLISNVASTEVRYYYGR